MGDVRSNQAPLLIVCPQNVKVITLYGRFDGAVRPAAHVLRRDKIAQFREHRYANRTKEKPFHDRVSGGYCLCVQYVIMLWCLVTRVGYYCARDHKERVSFSATD